MSGEARALSCGRRARRGIVHEKRSPPKREACTHRRYLLIAIEREAEIAKDGGRSCERESCCYSRKQNCSP